MLNIYTSKKIKNEKILYSKAAKNNPEEQM